MTIQLLNMNEEKNKVNKKYTVGKELEGELRDGADVVNPAIIVQQSVDSICGYNYAYIPAFKRFYFINNVQSFRTSLSVVSMTVDVLMTYKDTIMNAPALIVRSSKITEGELALPDERFPVKQSDRSHVVIFDSLYADSSDPGKGQTMVLVLTGIDNPS